ncbi:hypothetical protein [Glutamicibacter sp. TV12E]|uniref:hypothetical protein n=1 Tax=Glutamicibacter sp. TV12E TaxID=3446362 RepID=UPI004034CF53
MGMFDSLYDSDEREWQTKAYENQLAAYRQGDVLPELEHHPDITDYQVEILSGKDVVENGELKHMYLDSFATVIGNKLISIHDPRNRNLPRISYSGDLYVSGAEDALEGDLG